MHRAIAASALLALAGTAATAQTTEDAMMRPLLGFGVNPLLTVGEFVTNIDGGDLYQVTGIPDGMGAMMMDEDTVRFFVNHEFTQSSGTPFTLANGAEFPSGARVSVFDFDIASGEIVAGGLGFTSVVMDGGVEIDPGNIGQYVADYFIINRLCSASMGTPDRDGYRDYIFFTGEETGGGREWALDAANRRLYEVPAMGNGAWENVITVPATAETGLEGYTVVLLSDDSAGRPLYLYVGTKGDENAPFLERNGLADGQLYAWVADSGANTNTEFNGTGNTVGGTFVALTSNNPSTDITGDGMLNNDDDVQNMINLVTESGSIGAFFFSRPEDVAVNPIDTDRDPTTSETIFASTGRVTNLGDIDGDGTDDEINDPWGTTYVVTLDHDSITSGGPIRADLTIVYDGNEADKQDFGIRSPDNLEWAGDGVSYIQEDRSIGEFGADSGVETSIWRLDAATFEAARVSVIDRSAVPSGQTDTDPNDLGDWESSGIVDVTDLVGGNDVGRVLLFNVQAHSVRGGPIDEDTLVQGGQILLMHTHDCLADYNGDGVGDTRDVLEFLDDWAAGDPIADANGDGAVDTRDIILLLDIWSEGC